MGVVESGIEDLALGVLGGSGDLLAMLLALLLAALL